MMNKEINLNQSVYELVSRHPGLKEVLAQAGFIEIQNQAMLETAGRIMTLPKGAALKHIDLASVIRTLKDHGYLVKDMPATFTDSSDAQSKQPEGASSFKENLPDDNTPAARIALLKEYLGRLKSGDDLKAVQAEFKKNFQSVDAAEIMQAEQELMAQGTPLSEVQRLCDLHSALFHGHTRAEKIDQAEQALQNSLQKRKEEKRQAGIAQAARLEEIDGHPLNTLTRENEALSRLIADYENSQDSRLLEKMRDLSSHYAKKGDLLYPLLKVKYGISGPHNVMWTVDDEIRDELARLIRTAPEKRDPAWHQQVLALLKRAKEMIYKEQNILFPITAQYFSQEDWKQIEQDSHQYPDLFGLKPLAWIQADASVSDSEVKASDPRLSASEGLIQMPGGTMKLEQLIALLDTIPVEITFVDAKDINRYFNDGPEMKVFKRPKGALGREVYSCHPPKVEPIVRQIIRQFKDGSKNEVAVWTEKGGKPMYISYMAVRSKEGKFLGTLELVQDMEFARKHFLDQQ